MAILYLAFSIVVLALFWRLPIHIAVLATIFGGWLLLPVTTYPEIDPGVSFPWWITGLALPGDMLISKVWVIPTMAFAGAILFDPKALRRLRFCWLDVLMILWCFWPLLGGLALNGGTPAPALCTLYLLGSWGALWSLGRIWFADRTGQMLFLKACALSGIACLPFAVLEGIWGISLYQEVYGPHPYANDGSDRYVGYRPVGFFEHGNQYGLWVCIAALAAIWLAVSYYRSFWGLLLAVTAFAIALAAQSIGAVLLLGAGLGLMVFWPSRIIWLLLVVGFICALIMIALHLSGLIPLQWIARETEVGQFILSTFRSLGRGSFTWRISQDLKTMELIDGAWVTGNMIWDWWRPAEIRPWGLWLLLIGQFGLLGFALAYGCLIAVTARALLYMRGQTVWAAENPLMPLALILLMALADSMLNAFFYFPALLAAGAIAARPALEIDRATQAVTPSA